MGTGWSIMKRVQGDHYIWTNNFDKFLDNNSLDQPEQVKDTECFIMKGYKLNGTGWSLLFGQNCWNRDSFRHGYKVIHNERVKGDHYFWNKVFGPNSDFNTELIGPTLTAEGYRGIHNEKVQCDR